LAHHDATKDTNGTKEGMFMFLRVDTPLDPEQERLVTITIDCGLEVHRVLGPAFREPIYERAFCLELDARGIPFQCEVAIDVRYKQWKIPGQRIDLIVANVVLVEIKAVKHLKQIHTSQVVSYLKTTGLRVGLLMNFHGVRLKDGLKRIVR
jgi:GxxExxY protein